MLSLIEQDHDSAVGGSGVAEYSMGYTWESATPTGGRRTLRLDSTTYPDGVSIAPFYNSGSDSLDDAISRTTAVLRGGSTTHAAYLGYMGAGSVTRTDLQNSTYRDLRGTSPAAAIYPALDPFNRIVEDAWVKDLGTDVEFYDTHITYDPSHYTHIATVRDDVHDSWSQVYETDALCRITGFERGTLGDGVIGSPPGGQLDYFYDQAGNFDFWRNLNGDTDYEDDDEFKDSRSFNAANELIG